MILCGASPYPHDVIYARATCPKPAHSGSRETCGVTWGFMLWDLAKGMRAPGLPGAVASKETDSIPTGNGRPAAGQETIPATPEKFKHCAG